MKSNSQIISEYFSKKGIPLFPAITYADVTIQDRFSTIASRRELGNFRTEIARGFFINIPLISANMDTITEADMAIALARLGGIGAIHQFLPLEEKIKQLQKVKRADSGIIENPITISEDATLEEANEIINTYGISGILVINKNKKLINIISRRDVQFKENLDIKIKEALPKIKIAKADSRLSPTKARIELGRSLIVSDTKTSLEEAKKIFDLYRIEKLPLIDSQNHIRGLIVAKDIKKRLNFPRAVRDKKGRLVAMMTVGIKTPDEEICTLVKEGMDILLLDTARANSQVTINKIKQLKKLLPKNIPLVAGNIDSAEGALNLIKAGVDGLKVGIGPGSACKTRLVAGVGTPQITAIAECVAIAQKYKIPVWADGGLRGSADLAKSIVAGASAGFSGSLFAGTLETPGEVFYENGKKWKIYRGSASLEFQKSRKDRKDEKVRTTEGESRRIPFKGEVSFVIDQLLGGLQSAMSYVGARSISELQDKGKFRWQTTSGYLEGQTEKE